MFKSLLSFIKPISKKTFKCNKCGKEHDELPSLAYITPIHYSDLSEVEKSEIGELTSDTCVIKYPDQTDKFIRVVLTQKINSNCEDLNYGLWVSLSEKSFEHYSSNYNNAEHEAIYFGWISNNLEGYENTLNIPADIHTKPNGQRPEAVPHHDYDHPFVIDYYEGITKTEAENRINRVLTDTN